MGRLPFANGSDGVEDTIDVGSGGGGGGGGVNASDGGDDTVDVVGGGDDVTWRNGGACG